MARENNVILNSQVPGIFRYMDGAGNFMYVELGQGMDGISMLAGNMYLPPNTLHRYIKSKARQKKTCRAFAIGDDLLRRQLYRGRISDSSFPLVPDPSH